MMEMLFDRARQFVRLAAATSIEIAQTESS
jgi:hypothetical protein